MCRPGLPPVRLHQGSRPMRTSTRRWRLRAASVLVLGAWLGSMPLYHHDFVVADPVVAAPQEEGTVVIDDEEVGDAPLQHPTPAVVEADGGAPLPMLLTMAHIPATHQVQVHDGDTLAFVSALTGASAFCLRLWRERFH
ncbi:hypothetical protein VPH35_082313 [Triticum aestivum]